MRATRQPMPRTLPGNGTAASSATSSARLQPIRHDGPRVVRRTVMDFSTLSLPEDVRLALAEAFWSHFGAQAERCILTRWHYIKTFDRFAGETGAVVSVADIHRGLMLRYIDWLNALRRPGGQPWTKSC